MVTVTRFPTRASIAERMGDFTRHLRQNGFRVGVQETEMGLRGLDSVDTVSYTHLTLPTMDSV